MHRPEAAKWRGCKRLVRDAGPAAARTSKTRSRSVPGEGVSECVNRGAQITGKTEVTVQHGGTMKRGRTEGSGSTGVAKRHVRGGSDREKKKKRPSQGSFFFQSGP